MSTPCRGFVEGKRYEIIQNIFKFYFYYRLAQYLLNSWTFILIDYQQIVNKVAKDLRVNIRQFVSFIF